jgi:hypothetical protein
VCRPGRPRRRDSPRVRARERAADRARSAPRPRRGGSPAPRSAPSPGSPAACPRGRTRSRRPREARPSDSGLSSVATPYDGWIHDAPKRRRPRPRAAFARARERAHHRGHALRVAEPQPVAELVRHGREQVELARLRLGIDRPRPRAVDLELDLLALEREPCRLPTRSRPGSRAGTATACCHTTVLRPSRGVRGSP